MSNRVSYKRDANGRLVAVPVQTDSRGNTRPQHPGHSGGTAGTSAANWYVTSCCGCGRNNYNIGSSYCSRCR